MRGTPSVLKDFSPGLNLKDDPLSLPWGTASAMANVEPNGQGGLHRRANMVLVTASGAAGGGPTGNLPLLRVGATSAVNSEFFFSDTATGALRNVGFGGALAPGISVTRGGIVKAPFSPVGTQGPYFFPSQTPAKYWDEVSAGLTNWTPTSGTIPNGTGLYANNRIIVATSTRIQASAPGDPRDWSTAPSASSAGGWFVDIVESANDAILGIAPVGPYVIVFKRERVYLIYDLDTGANRVLGHSNIGTQGVFSGTVPPFCTNGSNTWWLGKDGIYETDGATIRSVSTNLGQALFLLASQDHDSLAVSGDFLVYVCAADNAFYVQDLRTGSWWRHTLATGLRTFVVESATAGEFVFMRAGAAEIDTWSPHVDPYTPTGTTDGTLSPATFTASWTSGIQDFGRPGVRKRVRFVTATGAVAAGALSVAANPDGAVATPRTSGLPSSRGTQVLPTWGVARLWTVGLSDSTSSRWSLDELEIDWQWRKG